MKKAIVIIRESTVRQEIESQTAEIVAYAKSFGYTDDEIVVIGEAGASAIKIDAAYQKNLNLAYKVMQENPIEKVFAWQLDRIARKPIPFYQFRDYLIEHKINMFIKNPTLYLLNDDGSINSGMEVAISLFLTLADQEMRTKKVRFMRAKKYISAQGKFIGARYMMYGYKTDENGYLVINEEEANVVKLIYKLYCTGNYGTIALAKELNERGYKFKGSKFSAGQVINILKNDAYIGNCKRNKLVTKYPVIISNEEFEIAKKFRMHRSGDKVSKSKEEHLAIKILKCWDCGSNYMYAKSGNDEKYVCYRRKQKARLEPEDICHNSCSVQFEVMDEILGDLAYTLLAEYKHNLDDTKKKELAEREIVLKQKVNTINYELEHTDDKFARVLDAYTDDLISKEQYTKRINKLKAEKENYLITLSQCNNELKDIKNTLTRNLDNFDIACENIMAATKDPSYPKKVVNKYIKVAYAKSIISNGIHFTIIMVVDYNNKIYNYIFQQKHGKREGLYTLVNDKLVNYQHRTLEEYPTTKIVEDLNNSSTADLNAQITALNTELLTKTQKKGS